MCKNIPPYNWPDLLLKLLFIFSWLRILSFKKGKFWTETKKKLLLEMWEPRTVEFWECLCSKFGATQPLTWQNFNKHFICLLKKHQAAKSPHVQISKRNMLSFTVFNPDFEWISFQDRRPDPFSYQVYCDGLCNDVNVTMIFGIGRYNIIVVNNSDFARTIW